MQQCCKLTKDGREAIIHLRNTKDQGISCWNDIADMVGFGPKKIKHLRIYCHDPAETPRPAQEPGATDVPDPPFGPPPAAAKSPPAAPAVAKGDPPAPPPSRPRSGNNQDGAEPPVKAPPHPTQTVRSPVGRSPAHVIKDTLEHKTTERRS